MAAEVITGRGMQFLSAIKPADPAHAAAQPVERSRAGEGLTSGH